MIHRLFNQSLDPNNSIVLDLSAANTDLNAEIFGNIEAFTDYIDGKLEGKIGYGGYLEHRVIYEAHENFATASADFRNIHLGIDFWTKAGTPVFAPLDGFVHSFQVNPGSGNYGPTIILYHPAEDIYSLYGHLASVDLDHIQIGDSIAQGQELCHLGEAPENGGWPPHLHFQLIREMRGIKGDYPGVCSLRDLVFYANNCPDPVKLL
jgi:murein DD-endopeptidase MepM/ murein hydrolase activator NlpD